MFLHEFIPVYGYAAIAVGSFLEGETTLILGGLATYQGYLDMPWVLLCAFAGTLLGDQLYFYIGRTKGRSFIDKKMNSNSRFKKIFPLLKKNQVLMILIFRFFYGLRSVFLLALGASKIEPRRFFLLNMLSVAIWVMVIGILGYLFGQTLQILMSRAKQYELWLFAGLGATSIIVWISYLLIKRKGTPDNQFKSAV